jgi:4-amino-4-deoxy-L-arabinose transferase-like glycosyltransferase
MHKLCETLKKVSRKSSTWSPAAVLVAISLLALAMRIATVNLPIGGTPSDEWDHIAANLARGRGYVSRWPKTSINPKILGVDGTTLPYVPTATRVPIPVFQFALIFGLFGVGFPFPLVISQWVVDILTGIVLYYVAMEIFDDRRVALLAALAWALYVPALWMARSRNIEPITTLFLAWMVHALLVALRTGSLWRYGMAGLAWGLSILSRPSMIVLPLFLLPVLLLLLRRKLGFAVLACTVIVLVGALVISPWLYRNYLLYGEFVISTLGGYNIFRDHYLIDQDDYLHYRDARTVQLALKNVLDRRYGSAAAVELSDEISKTEIEEVYSEEAFAKIRQYPGRFVVLSLVRFLRLWFNIGPGGRPSWITYMLILTHLTIVGLGIKALVSYRGGWMPKMLPALALIVQHTLVYMAIAGEVRYSLPLMPYLIMLACYALVCSISPPQQQARLEE